MPFDYLIDQGYVFTNKDPAIYLVNWIEVPFRFGE